MTPPLEKGKIRRASANPISGYWVPVENKKKEIGLNTHAIDVGDSDRLG